MIPMWKTEDKTIKPLAIRSDGEYKFEFYCLTTDLLQVKQAYSGNGLAAKRHKLTVKCHYSQALGTQDTQEQTLGSFQLKLIRSYQSKTFKTGFFAKMAIFDTFL